MLFCTIERVALCRYAGPLSKNPERHWFFFWFDYKYSSTVEYRDELHKCAIGKILRRALREETKKAY